MASTCCRPIADSCSHYSTVEMGFQFPTPPSPSDAAVFGDAARFNLSAVEKAALMTDLRFRATRAVGQLPSASRTAELPEDGEISESDYDDDDDDLPSLRQILASPKQAIEVIDLTSEDDDDDDGEGVDDDGLTEVSWHRNPRTTRHCVRLTSPPLTDCFRVADQLPSPPIALPAKLIGTYRRRRHNLV